MGLGAPGGRCGSSTKTPTLNCRDVPMPDWSRIWSQGHANGPRDAASGAILPGSGGRIRTYDLWVMRRMAPVPCLPSDPSASRLSSANRPWCLTPSSLSCRCPQRPYYCFYYDRPWIISENSARLPSHGDDLARWKLCGWQRASWPKPGSPGRCESLSSWPGGARRLGQRLSWCCVVRKAGGY
jgi:hypothetical protein